MDPVRCPPDGRDLFRFQQRREAALRLFAGDDAAEEREDLRVLREGGAGPVGGEQGLLRAPEGGADRFDKKA